MLSRRLHPEPYPHRAGPGELDQWYDRVLLRLRPFDAGFVAWNIAKQDFLDAVRDAMVENCADVLGAKDAAGADRHGNDIDLTTITGLAVFEKMFSKMMEKFPFPVVEN